MEEDLLNIKRWAFNITGEWNGDEPGSKEDRAEQALEIVEHVDILLLLINGMDEL